jgi:acetolactate synthase-1/2/3 large subunit
VLTSYQGKAVADWRHPLYVGPWASEPQVVDLCARSDLALVLGSKLSSFGTDYWRLSLPDRTFRVDAQELEQPKYPMITNCIGDVNSAIPTLLSLVPAKQSWANGEINEIQRDVPARARERGEHEMRFIDAIARGQHTPRMIAGDTTKAAFWAMKYLAVADGGLQSFSSYLAMGSALPMSIGIAIATAEPVLVIVGDGGLQMSIAEIATIGELQLPLTLLVIVDDAYGMLRDNGVGIGGSTDMGITIWNPDLEKLCLAYNIEHVRIDGPTELSAQLDSKMSGPRMLVTRQPFGRRW